MMKPFPYECIKRQEHPPSLVEFNKILDKISDEDKIGNLFIVDIKFLCCSMKFTRLSFKKTTTRKWSHMNGQLSSL